MSLRRMPWSAGKGLWLRPGPAGLHVRCADMSLRRNPGNAALDCGYGPALRAFTSAART
ncbi:hypothetical protein KAK06_03585 [Ideonella sp. 4Y11]|uniref:Uncharacterized protein n=1 Tax=Ideonella aquatica TaxID=2824119 RepID=A0A941BES5_9BURK|nr:hypothetical protein [Ideonella aquatica]